MELFSKIQSTKLGIASAGLVILHQLESGPWPVVAVVVAYLISNAIQNIGAKKECLKD